MTIGASRVQNMIVTEPDIEWGFTCKYETEYTVDGDATVSSASLDHAFNAENGQFSFDFKFYETEAFETEQTDASYQVGQQVNFGSKYNNIDPTTCEVLGYWPTEPSVTVCLQTVNVWQT